MNEVQKVIKAIERRRLDDIDDEILQLARRFDLPLDLEVRSIDGDSLAMSVAHAIEFHGLPNEVDVASLFVNLIRAVEFMRPSRQTPQREERHGRLLTLQTALRDWTIRQYEEETERARGSSTQPHLVLPRCVALLAGALPSGAKHAPGMDALAIHMADKCGMDDVEAAKKWMRQNDEAKALIEMLRPVLLAPGEKLANLSP